MELRDYLRILRKGWIVMLAVTIAGLVGGAIASLVSPTVYSSTAKVLVSVTSPEDVTAAELTQANALAQRKAIAYVNIVTSPDVLGPVVDDLGLETTPAALATRMTAASSATSGVIEIAATSSNAGQAADIANAVSSELSDFVDTVEKPQGGGESPVQLTVAQPAVAAASPTSPRTSLNLALGVLLGLALGVAAVLVRSVLDSRIHNLADVEAVTELPVLGGIAGARGPGGPPGAGSLCAMTRTARRPRRSGGFERICTRSTSGAARGASLSPRPWSARAEPRLRRTWRLRSLTRAPRLH